MLPVAVKVPPVSKLPPVILLTALSVDPTTTLFTMFADPKLSMLLPVTSPVALTWPPVRKLPPVTFPLADIIVLVMLLVELMLLPVTLALAITLAPVMSPLAVIVPPTDINPTVTKLAPMMLPTADTIALVDKLLLVIFPDPPSALLTTKEFKSPSVVKLELITLALSVVPVSNAAFELTLMPVN